MLLIVPAALAAIALVALRPARQALLQPRTPLPDPGPAPVSPAQRRIALATLLVTGLWMAAVTISRSMAGERPAWDYALPYLVFLAAWLWLEIPARRWGSLLVEGVRRGIGPLTTHALLVVALFAAVNRIPAAPALAVAAIVAHVWLWRARRPSLTPAFWLISLSLVLSCAYLRAWWFSAIGDEYAFFDFAAGLLSHADVASIGAQLYNPAAVYGTHPGFSSLIQAATMAVFGAGLFGWRFSNLWLAAVSVWPFYAFVDALGGRRLAILASTLLAGSHYVMSFGKIGYNNLQALFAFCLCLGAATWFVRDRTARSAVAFGAALGLTAFVYPAALLTLPVTFLYAAHQRPSGASPRRWAIVGAVVLATVLPIVMQPAFWDTKLSGTILQSPLFGPSGEPVVLTLLSHLGQAALSFLLTPNETHFVAVGFVDVLTAALVILGAGVLLRTRGNRSAVFLLAGLILLLILVGATHGYPSPPATRMFLLLPWFALLGGLGLAWIEDSQTALGVAERTVRRATGMLLALIVVANLVQAYPLSRLRMAGRYQSPQVLFLREARNLLDPGPNDARVLILSLPEHPLRDSLIRQLRLHQVSFAESSLVERDAQSAGPDIDDPRSIVLLGLRLPEALADRLESRLERAGKRPCRFRTSMGEVHLVVWASPGELWRCAQAPFRW